MSIQNQMERGASAHLVVANGAGVRIVTDMISRARQMLAQRILERAYRKAEKTLTELDDRMLRDIGLSRSEIASAVRDSERHQSAASPHVYSRSPPALMSGSVHVTKYRTDRAGAPRERDHDRDSAAVS